MKAENEGVSANEPRTKKQWGSVVFAGLVVLVALWFVNAHGVRQEISIIDHIFWSSFAVFASGFAVLLLLFVFQTILGHIDLPRALQDKAAGSAHQGSVSLSRLQVFMWTLLIMTTYFHEAVVDRAPGLPTIPPELLMVMGISSAVYLSSKGMSHRQEKP